MIWFFKKGLISFYEGKFKNTIFLSKIASNNKLGIGKMLPLPHSNQYRFMKNNLSLGLLLTLFIAGCSQDKITPPQLAKKILETYESHSSISYDIKYKIKYFSGVDDTTKVNARIDLIRIPEDSIFGGHVWISSTDSVERYYDTEYTYFISHPQKSITRYPKDKPYSIKGNSASETIRVYFLKPSRLVRGTEDSTNIIELTDTLLNELPTWHWRYVFPDGEEMANQRKTIWIDQQDFSVPKMTYTVDFQGENQYNEWNLSNIVFDQVTAATLKIRFAELEEKYELKDFQERPQEETEPLANGLSIPELKGELYSSGEAVALKDYRGKLLLIDFWYMDCYPCMKAIPHLNELHHKYSNQGLQVVGVDPYDNTEKNLKRLPNFLERNTLDYPIMFIDREDTEKFKIYAYPTFYLIDRAGKILHSQVGFGESMANEIDSLIQVHI